MSVYMYLPISSRLPYRKEAKARELRKQLDDQMREDWVIYDRWRALDDQRPVSEIQWASVITNALGFRPEYGELYEFSQMRKLRTQIRRRLADCLDLPYSVVRHLQIMERMLSLGLKKSLKVCFG